jgi:hypothetical protein
MNFKTLSLLTIILFIGASCTKEFEVSGRIFEDCELSEPLANQTIYIKQRRSNGTSRGLREIGELTTDKDGYFNVIFESNRRTVFLESNVNGQNESLELNKLEKNKNNQVGDISLSYKTKAKVTFTFTKFYNSTDTLIYSDKNDQEIRLSGPFVDFDVDSLVLQGEFEDDYERDSLLLENHHATFIHKGVRTYPSAGKIKFAQCGGQVLELKITI